ncbi:MAG TPA: TetR/AcrR family transcriptional regulator [Spirochaetota bacterium]|nr:TetR/AcrR family transcriptional regulator [Spirochaetota bacterium]HPU87137.1 TetR/AcrR family transcriptional regulator [Spirochaetota bacterium]
MNTRPERKDEIIAASLALIERKGIQNLTTKNISREVGITEPGIYRHFKNKQEILTEILRRFKNGIGERMIIAKERATNPLDQIGALYEGSLRMFNEYPSIAAAIFSEEIFQNNDRLSSEVRSIMELSQSGLRDMIRRGQSEGCIRNDQPDEQLSLIVMGAFRLLVTRWRLMKRSFDIIADGRKLWKTMRALLAVK